MMSSHQCRHQGRSSRSSRSSRSWSTVGYFSTLLSSEWRRTGKLGNGTVRMSGGVAGDSHGGDFVDLDTARTSAAPESSDLTSAPEECASSPSNAIPSSTPSSLSSPDFQDGDGSAFDHQDLPASTSHVSMGRASLPSSLPSSQDGLPSSAPEQPPLVVDASSNSPDPARDGRARQQAEKSRPAFVFMHYLMGTDPFASGRDVDSADADLTDAWSIAPRRRGVYNLVQVPMRFERLMVLCCCICLDEFLFLFTLLPIRCASAVVRVVVRSLASCTSWICSIFVSPRRVPWWASFARESHAYRASTIIDFMHMSIFVFTSLLLSSVDISSVYHSIRGQSVIKLYVVFNVMEIFDRLCCSFGVDILDSLGWTTGNAVNYLNSKRLSRARAQSPTREGATAASAVGSRPFRGFVLLTRVTVDYLFALVYVGIHASLLLIWVVTLNVAINTQNNALLTLLVSNNFVELKGAAFKSYKVQNLFQIACSDAVERFQLSVFLAVMLVYAEGDWRLLLTWAIIFLSEVMVDWIKHAFMTKFNRIPHRAYQQFSMVICRDVVQTKKNSAVRSIGGSGVAKRIGFISIPLGALVVRMASENIARLPRPIPAVIFLIMLTTKISLSVGLLGHAIRRLKPQPARGEYELAVNGATDDDEAWYQSLANVGRYDKS